MSRDEYEANRRKGIKVATVLIMLYLFIWAILFVAVVSRFGRDIDKHPQMALILLVTSALLSFVVPAILIQKTVSRSFGLLCPECGNNLATNRTVATTGQCPKCHAKLFYND